MIWDYYYDFQSQILQKNNIKLKIQIMISIFFNTKIRQINLSYVKKKIEQYRPYNKRLMLRWTDWLYH